MCVLCESGLIVERLQGGKPVSYLVKQKQLNGSWENLGTLQVVEKPRSKEKRVIVTEVYVPELRSTMYHYAGLLNICLFLDL